MSAFIYSGGKIAKTRNTKYLYTYNKLRSDYQDSPEVVSYFYPPIITCVGKNDKNTTNYSCFVEPKPVINPSINTPTPIRVSNLIKNGICYSKIQYTTASSKIPFSVNYLGRVQGQPGGSGSPPKNVLQ
jgi:hypothetical protein